MNPIQQWQTDELGVSVFADRADLGAAAAGAAVRVLQGAIERTGRARAILASAPSQAELIAGLARAPLDWSRVTLFHMDEYVGVGPEHPNSFRRWLAEHLLAHVGPAAFHGLRGEAPDADAECARYTALLREAPIDLVCLGIGENGHIAFNDPHVAEFDDPEWVKVIDPDEACRRQQVHDGWFSEVNAMPRLGLTLTVPALMSPAEVICVVPGSRKAEAIERTLRGRVATSCPASILRRHPRATLYLDADSARLVR
jgi:glucosamine-6-phosphate deaminase